MNASVDYYDASSTDLSNLHSYTVGYHYYKEDTTFITDLCHYMYDQGLKNTATGEVVDFGELYKDRNVDYGYTALRIISFSSHINVNGVNYSVKLQAQKPSYSIDFWYVFLEMYADKSPSIMNCHA
ncbi:MAG: hypothetical protein ACI4UT_01990 [Candidatus Enteromonas sp.]